MKQTTPTEDALLESIEACICRLEDRERHALAAAHLPWGNRGSLPRPFLRRQLRTWFGSRKEYLHAVRASVYESYFTATVTAANRGEQHA
jgi:hypothetical protein